MGNWAAYRNNFEDLEDRSSGYSFQTKLDIVRLLENNNHGIRTLGKIYGIPASTINNWHKNYKKHGVSALERSLAINQHIPRRQRGYVSRKRIYREENMNRNANANTNTNVPSRQIHSSSFKIMAAQNASLFGVKQASMALNVPFNYLIHWLNAYRTLSLNERPSHYFSNLQHTYYQNMKYAQNNGRVNSGNNNNLSEYKEPSYLSLEESSGEGEEVAKGRGNLHLVDAVVDIHEHKEEYKQENVPIEDIDDDLKNLSNSLTMKINHQNSHIREKTTHIPHLLNSEDGTKIVTVRQSSDIINTDKDKDNQSKIQNNINNNKYGEDHFEWNSPDHNCIDNNSTASYNLATKLAVVKLAEVKGIKLTSRKFNISEELVSFWCQKYQENGLFD